MESLILETRGKAPFFPNQLGLVSPQSNFRNIRSESSIGLKAPQKKKRPGRGRSIGISTKSVLTALRLILKKKGKCLFSPFTLVLSLPPGTGNDNPSNCQFLWTTTDLRQSTPLRLEIGNKTRGSTNSTCLFLHNTKTGKARTLSKG